MRVLLIEDEPTMARAIELMLSAEGLNVYTTDLGEEGLDLGKLYDYDIILLDLNLPDMHGYDVLKKLRVAKVMTPVLILSGNSEMDSKVRSFGFGADDYVTKPFHREELVARIHAVVRRSKVIRNQSSALANLRSTLMPKSSKSTERASTLRPRNMRSSSCCRCAKAPRLPRKCSSTTCMAGWTSRNSRSSNPARPVGDARV